MRYKVCVIVLTYRQCGERQRHVPTTYRFNILEEKGREGEVWRVGEEVGWR